MNSFMLQIHRNTANVRRRVYQGWHLCAAPGTKGCLLVTPQATVMMSWKENQRRLTFGRRWHLCAFDLYTLRL